MKTYRAAIVGLGRMGSTIDQEVIDYPPITLPYSIAAACEKVDRLELVAGADLLAEKREAFQERWGVTALYENYLEMIAKETPDVVAICTKGDIHAEMAIRVAEAGVPMIYLEKAMACSMLEADAVLKACRENGVRLNTGVLRRFDSRYRQAKQWIEGGEIGRPSGGCALRLIKPVARTYPLGGHVDVPNGRPERGRGSRRAASTRFTD